MQVINSSAELAVVSGGDDVHCTTDTMTCETEPSFSNDIYIDGFYWYGYADDLQYMGFTFEDSWWY